MARAERWFARFGAHAVFLGRLVPLVRSFVSVPAGVLGSPLGLYTVLTLAGSLIWCFGFAGVGWAVGSGYGGLHNSLRYVDYAAAAGLAAIVVVAVVRLRRPG
jgi:membrane protein DedA with SNARE-associated domain